ncbi:MAG: EpsI family protein [Gemmatimonadota bacterium]|nr:EpsI family protein [Gemmatimonadota bacterium]
MPEWSRWIPGVVLSLGCGLLLLSRSQESLPLSQPLGLAVPTVLLDLPSADLTISPEEQRVAGMTDYLLRVYGADSTRYDFSVYVGYYAEQSQGRTIHSPKNCLPGAGWEPVSSVVRPIPGTSDQVNRYLLANNNARAVVYYWYQGRGRIAWNEFAVKWELLRDKALHARSEEALVRIVIPLQPGVGEEEADALADRIMVELAPAVYRALPPGLGTA